jgi:hypothetical protein
MKTVPDVRGPFRTKAFYCFALPLFRYNLLIPANIANLLVLM